MFNTSAPFTVLWTSRRGRQHATHYHNPFDAMIGFRSHARAALRRNGDGVILATNDGHVNRDFVRSLPVEYHRNRMTYECSWPAYAGDKTDSAYPSYLFK